VISLIPVLVRAPYPYAVEASKGLKMANHPSTTPRDLSAQWEARDDEVNNLHEGVPRKHLLVATTLSDAFSVARKLVRQLRNGGIEKNKQAG